MRTLFKLTLITLTMAVGLAACASPAGPGRAAAIEAILQADRDFAALAASRGTQVAFTTYMDSVEGRLVRSSGDPIIGEAAIDASFANWPAGVLLHWAPAEGFASGAGDFGVSWGHWSLHPDGDGGSIPTARGRYVTVWHLDATGQWRGVLDLGNDDQDYPPDESEDEISNVAGDN